jgi:putative ABC transport system substrate-binding protein
LVGGAAAWPLAAEAQQRERVRRIGWLGASSEGPGPQQDRLNAFKRTLAQLGWIEGGNLAFDERWANNEPARLPSLAADLVALRTDLIFVSNSQTLSAARRATGIIPIIFSVVADPVGQGFVSSLAQPGGNITGFAGSEFALATKNLELLKKIAPSVTRVSFMYDPAQPAVTGTLGEIEAVTATLGVEVSKMPVRNAGDIERSIDALALASNSGLFVLPGSATVSQRELIVALAARHRLPAVYSQRYFAVSGGLASYGTDDLDLTRRAASYADRILKGEKPADLPVQLPTKFELVLNLKTAKAMGLTLPPEVLALADEVIE